MDVDMSSQETLPPSPTPSEADTDEGEREEQLKAVENGRALAASLSSYNQPDYPVLPSVDMDDWQYVMRRTMQEVIPGLFLGKIDIIQ